VTQPIEKEEFMALQRIFHLPHHAFPRNSYYYLLEGGFRKIIPLKVIAKAALIRTAYKTCTVWEDELKQLNAVRDDNSNMNHLAYFPDAEFHPDNKWWSSAAFVDNLAAAKRYVIANKITIPTERPGMCSSLQACVTKQIANLTLTSDLARSVVNRLERFMGKAEFERRYDCASECLNLDRKTPPALDHT
jgi:hypothetical protein